MADPAVCAYCGLRRAVNKDHVVAKTYQRKLRKAGIVLPPELAMTVPSCFECNIRKSTRKLVPPSWVDKIPALKELVGGQWRTWDGNPRSKSFSAVHR